MPLSPAPLLPGSSPLPQPGRRPPDRRALRLGALAMLPALIVALLSGPVLLPNIGLLVAHVQGQAGGGVPNAAGAQFQGFVYNWTASQTGGGYTTPASLQNMRSQADTFHMNAVIIPVVADMPVRSGSTLNWHAGQKGDQDTLSESDYTRAVQDARKAGLLPILELQVRQYDTTNSGSDTSGSLVGRVWYDSRSTDNYFALGGSVGTLEKTWFDNYSAFASEYARLSQKLNLPYFIIGDDLANVTTDTNHTTAKADPYGIDRGVPGESFPTCAGRRDCEWRHVIHAVRSPEYATFIKHVGMQGGGYTGKLIYAANWGGADSGNHQAEFENITWWDAVDIIGVDAYFPLTQMSADLDVGSLQKAWTGTLQTGPSDQKNITQRLATVSAKYGNPILFTSAGYASSPGANTDPANLAGQGATAGQDTAVDGAEQLNDMQALLATFNGLPWWDGVFWNGDEPISPRTKQQSWASDSNWAGDTLDTSKPAGLWLASYYQNNPLPCGC
ncbi:MAG TPA: hypothetical protein VF812_12755 [Ktedonobacterales bacterium]